VVIIRVRKNSRSNQYELKLGRILNVKYWNARTEQPASR
jgi:hypothetical protein